MSGKFSKAAENHIDQKKEMKDMSRLKTPFRYDYVGSFLRPEELISMRKDFEDGKITAEELKAAEDRCIADLVTMSLRTESSAERAGIWILCGD